MDAWIWIVIVVAILAVVAFAAWQATTRRRTQQLRDSFGPEYERTVEQAGSRKEAESDLKERRERREQLEVKALAPGARDRYLRSWEQAQARFVDDPAGAVGDAAELIQDVMRERGYPVEDFDQRAADLSVDHPQLVDDYRTAHAIARRNVHGEAETEELRQAFVHYRSLFEELLETRSETVET